LAGELDLSDQAVLEAAIERARRLGPATIIDLAEATFVDSSILMVIVHALRRAEASEGATIMLVVPLRSPANRLLVLSGFTQLLLPIAETRDECLPIRELIRRRPGDGRPRETARNELLQARRSAASTSKG
jgi:anti-anti-sigma factor